MAPSELRNLTNLGDLRKSTFPVVSQADLAAEMGVSGAYVSLVERGLRPVSDELLARYTTALMQCRERAKARSSAA